MSYRPFEYARRSRDRAEELRRIADNCQNEIARTTYLRLAEEYEVEAERSAAVAAALADRASPVHERPWRLQPDHSAHGHSKGFKSTA